MKKTILFTLFMTILSINSQTTHPVNAGSFYYTPNQLTISQGDIVEWVNDGGLHDVNGNINSITGLSFGNPESFSSSSTGTVGAIIYTHQFDIAGNTSMTAQLVLTHKQEWLAQLLCCLRVIQLQTS